MKNTITFRKVLRPFLVIALAGITTLCAVAQPRQHDDRDKRGGPTPPRAPAPAVSVRVQTPVGPRGFMEVRYGNDRFYSNRGVYYRSGPRGYVVVRPPIGLRVPVLPLGIARIYVNNALFFRYNNTYYRPAPGGYIVVDTPTVVIARPAPVVVAASPTVVVAAPATPAPAAPVVPVAANVSDNDYQTLWVNGAEYQFKDGQFFQKTADGLVWVEPLMGALIAKLPADATSVWYQEIEYFDCDSVYFKKTPDGYKVVEAPWSKES